MTTTTGLCILTHLSQAESAARCRSIRELLTQFQVLGVRASVNKATDISLHGHQLTLNTFSLRSHFAARFEPSELPA